MMFFTFISHFYTEKIHKNTLKMSEIPFVGNDGVNYTLCPITKLISCTVDGKRVVIRGEPFPGFKQQLLQQYHNCIGTRIYNDYPRSINVHERRLLPSDVEEKLTRFDVIRLTSENNELKLKNEKLESTVLNKEFIISQLRKRVEEQLQKPPSNNNELLDEIAGLKQKLADTPTFQSELQELQELRAFHESWKLKESQELQELRLFKLQHEEKQNESDKYKELFKEGKKKITNLEKQISNYEKQHESFTSEIQSLKKRLDEKITENKQLSDSNVSAKNTVKNMTKQCNEAKELIKSLRQEIDDKQEQNLAQQTIMIHLTTELDKKTFELGQADYMLRLVKTNILDKDHKEGVVHREVMSWKTKYLEIKAVLEEADKQMEFCKKQSEYHIQLRLDVEAELDVSKQRCSQFESEIENVCAQLEMTKLKYNELRMKYIQLNGAENIE